MSEALAFRVAEDARVETGRPHPATAVLAATMLTSAVVLLYAGRHLTFFYDEWTFILNRRGGSLGTYLDPHNGHLSLFPVVVYKTLFALVGLRHYTPYQVVGIALHLLCAGLVYVIARRRVGPWLALAPTTLLLFMGTAFQDLLWPFQMGYLASIAGGLGALALLDRADHPRDVMAAALLVWSAVSSGVGIAFVLSCAVLLVASRQPWRRLWILAVPAVVYVIWYIGWGGSEQTSSDAILAAPQYIANSAAATAAGIAGVDDAAWGPSLAVGLFVAVAVGWRARRRGAPTPMLLAAVVGALAFWTLTAVTRADVADPAASRYLYVGAVFILLIVAEASFGFEAITPWLALSGVLLLAALVANLGALRGGERGMRGADAAVRASLAAVQIAAPVVSSGFLPAPAGAPQITAGPYLAAARDLGSPALSIGQLKQTPETTRLVADRVLEHAERLGETQGPSAPTGTRFVTVTGFSGGQLVPGGLCEQLRPTAPGAYVDVQLNPGSELLMIPSAPVIYLRRLASEFAPAPFTPLAGRGGALISFPLDRAPSLPWQVRVAPLRTVDFCVR